jgi:hypothetical protein
MVTLLGFFFILSNVICLVIFMPDLVGPVRYPFPGRQDILVADISCLVRARHGSTTALHLVCGCIQPWTMWTVNKLEGRAHQAV